MDDTVRELERLALEAARARGSVEARRSALARYALVWWEGPAADRYRALVDERRARLARLSDELGWLEESVGALLAAERAEAAARAVPEAS